MTDQSDTLGTAPRRRHTVTVPRRNRGLAALLARLTDATADLTDSTARLAESNTAFRAVLAAGRSKAAQA